jgi:DNA polymerase III alpha subunit (gram-positive type)
MREVIIDFEGCLQGGIREIGIIETIDLEIANTWDVTIKEKQDVTNTLLAVFEEKPNYIVAHNAQIEKNLIREYLPYPKYEERVGLHSHWGPWLDTLTAYRTLYPSIKDYSLEKLTATFVEIKDLNALVKSYCQEEKGKAHFALYDAICTLMLVKRIAKLIDLASFIK